MAQNHSIIDDLKKTFPEAVIATQDTQDEIPTVWAAKDRVSDVLRRLKTGVERPYRMLYDLTAIDERPRAHRQGQPDSRFTVVYHLLSFDRNEDVRIKVPLTGESPSLPSITGLWPSANWYEREAWDMFGIAFDGHPHLQRILMPPRGTVIPCARTIPRGRRRWAPSACPKRRKRRNRRRSSSGPKTGA